MLVNANALVGAFFIALAGAHMQLDSPATFNASNNPHRTTPADPYLQYPYDCCGPHDRWTYPCRGYLSLLGTPEGAPTASWPAGSEQTWSISGIGNHYGGSCQVGFSVDHGETFRVATSYEGNCPHRNNGDGPEGQEFPFTVPRDLDTGVQVFAWIWYNREQEFNMNCAAVNITLADAYYGETVGSLSAAETNILRRQHLHRHAYRSHNHVANQAMSLRSSPGYAAFTDRPHMLIADDGNGCLTPRTTAELRYPDPGPDVVDGDGAYPLELPIGNCSVMPGIQAYGGQTGEDGH